MPVALKLNNKTYIKIDAGTDKRSYGILAGESFDFVGGFMNYKGCPANYYAHFNTIKINPGKKQN
jgi:hypothetical protein